MCRFFTSIDDLNELDCFSVEIVDRESIGVSSIFLKLLILNEAVIVSDLGQEQITANFFQQMARLTCHFAENASRQDSVLELYFIFAIFERNRIS